MVTTESASQLRVEFVSPEEMLFSGVADSVIARTRGGGDIAFLIGHEPFIGSLVTSVVTLISHEQGTEVRFCVRGGFISVDGQKVTVLSDAAVAVADISPEEAKIQLSRAQAAHDENPDSDYAEADLAWAQLLIDSISDVR